MTTRRQFVAGLLAAAVTPPAIARQPFGETIVVRTPQRFIARQGQSFQPEALPPRPGEIRRTGYMSEAGGYHWRQDQMLSPIVVAEQREHNRIISSMVETIELRPRRWVLLE